MPLLPRQRILVVATGASLFAGLVGCGSELKLVPVSGTVLKPDGKPLVAGRVTFWPIEDPKAFIGLHKSLPFAITDVTGQFTIAMNSKEPGCPPGKYQITVSVIRAEDAHEIPKRYTERQTTPWELAIPGNSRDGVVL